jgi:hypothetical protein
MNRPAIASRRAGWFGIGLLGITNGSLTMEPSPDFVCVGSTAPCFSTIYWIGILGA